MSKDAEILFTGRMNSDDEERFIPFGDYRDAKFLRSGTAESQNAGAKETYKGNSLKAFGGGFLPAGTNTLFGSCPDTKRKGIILLYHNSNNVDSIVLMDTITESYTMVLQGDLGFDLNYPIIDAGVIGNILKYTDGKDSSTFWVAGVRQFNPMMGFNIEKAIDGFYTTVDLQSIEVLKYPPMLAPTAVFGTELGVSNRIRQGLYEFRAAYISTDNEATTLSAVSDMPMKTVEEWVQGIDYASPFNDNFITVTIDSGHYTIRKIRLYVRTNSGLWYLMHEVDKDIEGIADNVPYSFDFFNDIIFTPVGFVTPDNDNVPQTALRQEITQAKSSSEVIYGDYFTGYDNIEVDYEVSHAPIAIPNFKPDYANLFVLGANDYLGVEGRITISADSYTRFDFSAGDTFSVGVTVTTPDLGNIVLTYSLTQADIDFALSLAPVAVQVNDITRAICDGWAAQMNALNALDFLTTSGGGGAYSIIALNYAFQQFHVSAFNRNVLSPVTPTRRTGVKRSLKKGWTYYVALQYMDRGKRNGTVQKQTLEYILKVPWPSEEALRLAFADPNSPYYVLLQMAISNLPPIWSTHYSVVVKKVRPSFEQRSSISIVKEPATNLLMISLENQSTRANGEMISHQVQVGDIVRFVTMNYPNDLLSSAKYTDAYIETQVVKYDPTGGVGGTECIWVYLFETGSIVDGTPTDTDSQLLEIYTQTKQVDQTDDSPWFEIATGEIGGPHTADAYHKGINSVSGTIAQWIDADQHWEMKGVDMSLYIGYPIVYFNLDGSYTTGIVATAVFDSGLNGYLVTLTNGGGGVDGDVVPFQINYDQIVTGGVSLLASVFNPNWGDVWFRQRDMGTGWAGALATHCYYYVEDPSYSGYYKSDYYGLGRPAFEKTNNERIRQSEGVLHSQTFLEDTLINGLSNFNGLDNFKQLSEKDGPITRLVADGQTLHVIQEQCTTPIYRGVNTTDASGSTTNLAFTTNTFGAIGKARPCGSVHPLSIQMIDGIIYGYDYFRGKVFILTNEDDYDICEGPFKMKNYITEKTQYVRDNFDDVKILSLVDEANKEYILNFNLVETSPPSDEHEAIVFKYSEKRWTHKTTFPMKWAENLGSYLITSNGTNIYRHNEGLELSFYGTVYEASLTFSFNTEPTLIKRPLAFCQKSNSVWEVDEIVVSASTNYPTGMTSMIPATEFKPLEDYLYSAYLNDSSNVVAAIPDLVDTSHALINGRNLIGPSMLHTLTITPTDKVVLFSVKIVYDLSLPLK